MISLPIFALVIYSTAFVEGVLWLESTSLGKVELLDRTTLNPSMKFYPFASVVNKFVIHTTEGPWPKNGSWESAIATLDSRKVWPHFIVAADKTGAIRVGQFLPLDVGGRSLRAEANDLGAIQVEVGAKASSPFTEMDFNLTQSVKALFAEVRRHVITIPNRCDPLVVYRGEEAAGETASQRLCRQAWIEIGGIVGHQHAPLNTHWDPGVIDCTKLLTGPSNDVPLPRKTYPRAEVGCVSPDGVNGQCVSSNEECIQKGGKASDGQIDGGKTCVSLDVTNNFVCCTGQIEFSGCLHQVPGICKQKNKCSKRTAKGLCPGASNILCCLSSEAVTTGTSNNNNLEVIAVVILIVFVVLLNTCLFFIKLKKKQKFESMVNSHYKIAHEDIHANTDLRNVDISRFLDDDSGMEMQTSISSTQKITRR